MKRTLAIALSLAASSAFAQTGAPQPSFIDYPVVEASVPARADASRDTRQALPQPSFIDYVAIEADQPVTTSGRTIVAEFPKPSFAN